MTDKENDRNINEDNIENYKIDEPPWGNFFGDLLNVICINYNNDEDKGKALYDDIEKMFSISCNNDNQVNETLNHRIDPLTLIGYFASQAKPSVRQNRLNVFFQVFKPKVETVFDLFKELKRKSKNIFNNNYILNLTFLDNIKNYKQSIDKLWIFAQELNNSNKSLPENEETKFNEAFTNIIPNEKIKINGVKGIKISNLSSIMYLCNPKLYYPLDETMFTFIKANYKDFSLLNNYKTINSLNSHCKYEIFSYIQNEFRKLGRTPYLLYREAINYKNDNKYLGYLNRYFYHINCDRKNDIKKNNKEPVCREERQYALFLYNRLLNMVDKKFETLSIDDQHLFRKIFNQNKKNTKILRVYYEVSFLRDFFKKGNLELKDYLDFNKKLYDYVLSIFYSEEEHNLSKLFNSIIVYSKKLNYDYYKEYLPSDSLLKNDIFNRLKSIVPLPNRNYGSITKKDANNIKNIPSFVIKLMQTMMNSKPDIGIIYEKQDKKYLKFIECKYISREGSMNLLDINCDNNNKKDLTFHYILRQTHIQYYIAVFVCKELIGNNRIEADIPLLLKFTNKNKSKNNNENNLGDYYFPFTVDKSVIYFSELIPECFKNNLFD